MEKSENFLHELLYDNLMFFKNINEKLLFTFRPNNIDGKLDRGYWFYGDQTTAKVSFWNSISTIDREPNISFCLTDEYIYLEVKVGRSEYKRDFFKERILSNFDYRTVGEGFNGSKYRLDLGNVRDLRYILDEFLRTIKLQIDKDLIYYKESYVNEDRIKYSREEIDFINENDFQKQYNRVNEYREHFLRSEEFERSEGVNINKPIYLNSFSIKKFGILDTIQMKPIPPDNRWIFITGENGVGKSLILKAITVFLGRVMIPKNLVKNTNNELSTNFKFTLVSNKKELIQIERHENEDGSRFAKSPIVRGFACYGIHRMSSYTLTRSGKIIGDPLLKNGITESILNNMVSPLLNLEWYLKKMDKEEYEKFNSERKNLIIQTLIEIVPGLVDMSVGENFKIDRTIYFIQHEGGEVLSLDYLELSSGTRSILSLVTDIFIRFYDQQPEMTDPSSFRGIVIIDEIDMHLHPTGQRDLVVNLGRIFPNIQFIVTSHSPMPLLGAPINSVFLTVKRGEFGNIILEQLPNDFVSDLLPNTILTSPIFGVDKIFPRSYNYEKRLHTEDTYDEKIKRDEIRESLKYIAKKIR